jgi:hypothetical protein
MPLNYFSGPPLRATAPTASLLALTVRGALVAQKGAILSSAAETFIGLRPSPRVAGPLGLSEDRRTRLQTCLTSTSSLMAYKARPLEGIWATAPYLHNGSVPTLYDLFLPAARRLPRFLVGTREFDPIRVGFVTEPAAGNSFTFETSDASSLPIPGNSNFGHEYGAGELTDAQRWELVEYLKSL